MEWDPRKWEVQPLGSLSPMNWMRYRVGGNEHS